MIRTTISLFYKDNRNSRTALRFTPIFIYNFRVRKKNAHFASVCAMFYNSIRFMLGKNKNR